MSYQYITQYDAACYTPGRTYQGVNYAVNKIVIHHWGADGQTFDSVVGWFTNPNCGTSAHYVVEAGKVACMVNLYDTAYHASDWFANLSSIGIECRPEMSDGDLETVCELVAYLYGVYGELPIYPHKYFSKTACPGRYEAKLDYIRQRALEILNGQQEETTESESDEMTQEQFNAMMDNYLAAKRQLPASDWAKETWQQATASGLTDGTMPQDFCTREQVVTMIQRAKAQG